MWENQDFLSLRLFSLNSYTEDTGIKKVWLSTFFFSCLQRKFSNQQSTYFSFSFFLIFLRSVNKIKGRKILFGDNLSSHINLNVIQLWKDNNNSIDFVCLPPYATHTLHPLDVGLYALMMHIGRLFFEIIRMLTLVPNVWKKTAFPGHLKELLEKVDHERATPTPWLWSVWFVLCKQGQGTGFPKKDARLLKYF